MNADDVVFTFQRIFDRNNPWHNVNGSNFPYFDSLQFADNVKSVRKLDNHTVEFRLAQPDASFLWHLATHYASVMSAEYAGKLEKEDRRGATRPSTGRHWTVSVVGIPRRAIYSPTTS